MSKRLSRGRGRGSSRRPIASRDAGIRSWRSSGLSAQRSSRFNWPPECVSPRPSPPLSLQFPPVLDFAPVCTSSVRPYAELSRLEFELTDMSRGCESELADEGVCAKPTVRDVSEAVRSAAKLGVEAVWKAAQDAGSAVREAGGLPGCADGANPDALLKRAEQAEQELRKASAELRLARAELMLCIGVEGRALQSTPCWEPSGSWSAFGNGFNIRGVERCTDCNFDGKLYLDRADGFPYCAQCWHDCYGDWPSSKDRSSYRRLPPRLMLEKYEVHVKDVLGKGGFSIVRRGRDVKTGEVVAVKTYSAMEDMDPSSPELEEDKVFFLGKFRHEVDTFQQLHASQDVRAQIGRLASTGKHKRNSWYVPEGLSEAGSSMLDVFSDLPSCSELFVQLLDFSKDEAGMPAASLDNGDCCVVLELAEYTLDEFLSSRYEARSLLDVEEVREIFHQLAQVIAVLHAKQFVHCDLKPGNVMYFASGRWKLIDMDGMVTTGRCASLCDVFYTPHYCAPEFALSCLESEDLLFEVSRLLDVWSLGMIGVELVTFKALLLDKYNSFGEDDCEGFLAWLADLDNQVALPPEVAELDPQLNHLCCQMLEKDKNLRASMVEVLVHPFFTEGLNSGGSKCVEEKRNRHQGSQNVLKVPGGGRDRKASGTVVRRRASVQLAENSSNVNYPLNSPAVQSPGDASTSEKDSPAQVLDSKSETWAARCSRLSAFSDVSDKSNSSRASTQQPPVTISVSEANASPERTVADEQPSSSAPPSFSRLRPGLARDSTELEEQQAETPQAAQAGSRAERLALPQGRPMLASATPSVASHTAVQAPSSRVSAASNSIGVWSDRSSNLVPSTRSEHAQLLIAKDQFSQISRASEGVESWSELREKARSTQLRVNSLCQLLRNKEEAAAGMEELWRAAAKAEAALWREAGCSPVSETMTTAPESCAAMESQVASAGRELRAASLELLQRMPGENSNLNKPAPEVTLKAAPKAVDIPLISGVPGGTSGTPVLTGSSITST